MLSYVEPPNQRIKILTNLLKMLCVLTVIVGIFKVCSQGPETGSFIYLLSGFCYIISWRGLSYYYCMINQILNLSIIFTLLQQMAKLLENGLYQTYFSSSGFYKMGCLIFSIVAIYFNFFAYRYFKQLALQIFQYEQKQLDLKG